jgi:putative transposase
VCLALGFTNVGQLDMGCYGVDISEQLLPLLVEPRFVPVCRRGSARGPLDNQDRPVGPMRLFLAVAVQSDRGNGADRHGHDVLPGLPEYLPVQFQAFWSGPNHRLPEDLFPESPEEEQQSYGDSGDFVRDDILGHPHRRYHPSSDGYSKHRQPHRITSSHVGAHAKLILRLNHSPSLQKLSNETLPDAGRANPRQSGCRVGGLAAFYATKHQGHGFRRAWAAPRFDEGSEVNKKRLHRLWREEGLQVRAHSPRKRAGCSTTPLADTNAPKVVWALDFQFDSTVDGRAVKIASMIDEHTRESRLHLVERSITAERLVAELQQVFAARGGPPKVLCMDNGPEIDFPCAATVLRRPGGDRLHPARHAVEQRSYQIVQPAVTQRVPQPQPLDAFSRPGFVIGHFKDEHNRQHRHSALGYLTQAEYAARCRITVRRVCRAASCGTCSAKVVLPQSKLSQNSRRTRNPITTSRPVIDVSDSRRR